MHHDIRDSRRNRATCLESIITLKKGAQYMSNLILNFISFNELSPTMKLVFITAFAILSLMFFCLSIEVRNKKSDYKSYSLFVILWSATLGLAALCAVLAINLLFFGYLMQ